MEHVPHYVSITFLGCVVATFGFLYYAYRQASEKGTAALLFTTSISIWICVVSLLALQGFFQNFEATPPRLIPFVTFAFLVVLACLIIKPGRRVIEKMPITTLTYVHIIRVPVEIVLWWLFIHGMVAEGMTFEGMNYDILSGISAPFAGLFLVGLKSRSRLAAISWNLLTLGLLINIVIRAVMATPYFYDPPAGEQANLAVFYFPYILLPTFVVPAIFFCHMASLYVLIKAPKTE